MSSHAPRGAGTEVVFRNVKGISLVLGFWVFALVLFTWMLWPFLRESLRYSWAYVLAVPFLIPTLFYARSKVVVGESDVVVVNPFRTYRFPVGSVISVEAGPPAFGWGMTGYLYRADGARIRMYSFECGRGWACVDMKQEIERLGRLVAARKKSGDD